MDWGLIIVSLLAGTAVAIYVMMRREAKKSVTLLSEKEFTENMRKGQLIDVRKKESYEEGHINGARNIPFAILTRNPGRVRKDLPIYLYCENGKQCKRVAVILAGKGHEHIYQLDGGLTGWTGKLKPGKK